MVAIEYVDANGVLQTVVDPTELKAAAGCFGLLGIVTHITFELEAMTYAVLKPKKTAITLAIPPLKMSDVPLALYKNWTEKDIQAAKADFENRATNDFYSEWFWYTYQNTAWVNSWNPTSDPKGAKEFPSPAGVFLQWLQCWMGGWFSQTFFFQNIPGRWQAQFLAIAGMAVLPPTLFDTELVEYKTTLPNGLHFFRGVSHLPCNTSRSLTDNSLGRYKIAACVTWNLRSLFHLWLPTHPSPTSRLCSVLGGMSLSLCIEKPIMEDLQCV